MDSPCRALCTSGQQHVGICRARRASGGGCSACCNPFEARARRSAVSFRLHDQPTVLLQRPRVVRLSQLRASKLHSVRDVRKAVQNATSAFEFEAFGYCVAAIQSARPAHDAGSITWLYTTNKSRCCSSIFSDDDEGAEMLQILALIRTLLRAGDQLADLNACDLVDGYRPFPCKRVMIVCAPHRLAHWASACHHWLQVRMHDQCTVLSSSCLAPRSRALPPLTR